MSITNQDGFTSPSEPLVSAPQPVNYWGTTETSRYNLPDGEQWIEFKLMNEGDKAKFQRMTNQDVQIGRDQTAKVRMDPASERHQLIKTSVTGWHLYAPDSHGNMAEAAFSAALLDKWLTVGPPKIIEELELAIRKANPWMQAEWTADAIREEIKDLEERLREIQDREAGETVSVSK